MTDGLDTVRKRLESLARQEFREDIVWDGEILMSNVNAQTLLDYIDTMRGLKGAMDMGRLSHELLRVLMSQSNTETFDLTGKLPDDDEITQPLEAP